MIKSLLVITGVTFSLSNVFAQQNKIAKPKTKFSINIDAGLGVLQNLTDRAEIAFGTGISARIKTKKGASYVLGVNYAQLKPTELKSYQGVSFYVYEKNATSKLISFYAAQNFQILKRLYLVIGASIGQYNAGSLSLSLASGPDLTAEKFAREFTGKKAIAIGPYLGLQLAHTKYTSFQLQYQPMFRVGKLRGYENFTSINEAVPNNMSSVMLKLNIAVWRNN